MPTAQDGNHAVPKYAQRRIRVIQRTMNRPRNPNHPTRSRVCHLGDDFEVVPSAETTAGSEVLRDEVPGEHPHADKCRVPRVVGEINHHDPLRVEGAGLTRAMPRGDADDRHHEQRDQADR